MGIETTTLARMGLDGDPAELERLRRFVGDALGGRGYAEQAYLVVQAVDEVVANIMEHGYEGRPGPIEVSVEVADGVFRAWIRDQGGWFDPGKGPDLDIRDHLRRGRTRGLGLPLIRRIVDDMRYEWVDDGWHELYLEKRLARAA